MNYDFLDEQQIKSFRRSLPAALDYHFTNFQRLEISAVRIFDATWWNDTTLEERLEVAHALTNITFEVQTYLNQLRHVSYFLKSRQISQKIVGPPSQPGWREVYDSIMDQNGMIHMLANMWSAHRSYNSPRQEDINLHKEVLLNLSSGVTMWSNGHYKLGFQRHWFNPCSFHPKVIDFLNGLFQELSQRAE